MVVTHRKSSWIWGVFLGSATVAAILGEAKDSASSLANASAKLCESHDSLVNLGDILLSEIVVWLKEEGSNAIKLSSDLENICLKVTNDGLRLAIISLIKAEAGDLEVELVEAAILLDIEANLVKLAYWLEDLEEIFACQEAVEFHDVSVGAFA